MYGPNTVEHNHIMDPRYANDRFEIIRAYHILQKDLLNILDYIEPADDNLKTYSHRTYEILLRAATEFESNCKKILIANGYRKKPGDLNIKDYSKVNVATRLNEYKLFVNTWSNGKKELQPLKEWKAGHKLRWYSAYNAVKHDRKNDFHHASLENVINAVGATFCVIFAQFHSFIFTQHNLTTEWHNDDASGEISHENSLFSVILPNSWTESDTYDYQKWKDSRGEPDPFENYPFS